MPKAWTGVVVALAALVAARTLHAATFTVDSPGADLVDATPGDGTCATNSLPVRCTLRAAVMEANALPGPDEIVLAFGNYVREIPDRGEDLCATGDLDVLDELRITGAGPTQRSSTRVGRTACSTSRTAPR